MAPEKLITRSLPIPVPDGPTKQKLGFLADIVNRSAEHLTDQIWDERRVLEITEQAASHAWVAAQRAYGDLDLGLGGVHVSSRVKRLIYERAGRVLRTKAHALKLCEAALNDDRQDFKQVEWRNMKRSIRKHAGTTDPYEIIQKPALNVAIVHFDAVDKQCAFIRDDNLHALLPTKREPERKDWEWVEIPLETGKRNRKYADWERCKPALRVVGEKMTFLLPVRKQVPLLNENTQRVLALDWGIRRLLTGALVWQDNEGVVRTSGCPYYFQAAGAIRNLERTRSLAQHLNGKIARIQALLDGRNDPTLAEWQAVLRAEADRQWAHVRHLNDQLACHAANWVVHQALSMGVDTIAVEDLRSLEGRRLGRHLNERVSQSVRGQIFERLRDRAEEAGLRVIRVNPRGTSKYCSRCSREIKHSRSPNGGAGHGWVVCACSRSSDRDHSAAERIGSRALDKATPSVRVTRSKRPKPLPPLLLLTPGRRSLKRSPCPSSVNRAFTPELARQHHVKHHSSSRVRSKSDAQLDAFRHHARVTRVRDNHSINVKASDKERKNTKELS